MRRGIRSLVVADTDAEASWVRDTVREGNHAARCLRVEDAGAVRAALAQGGWDVVVGRMRGSGVPAAWEAVRYAEGDVPPLVLVADTFEGAAEEALRAGAAVCLRDRGIAQLGLALERAVGESTRRARGRVIEAFEKGQRRILERVAGGAPLAEVLEAIVLLIEAQAEGMLCSILLVDAER